MQNQYLSIAANSDVVTEIQSSYSVVGGDVIWESFHLSDIG